MIDRIRGWLLDLLRVPTEPSVPDGGGNIRIFRASRNYYRYRVLYWILLETATLVGLIASLYFLGMASRWFGHPYAIAAYRFGEILAWAGFIGLLPFRFVLLRLDFELRWYVLSDRSLRIREGIISLREKTMTFANVQQVSVRQNPLQRLLGIADVQVSSAGGGAAKPDGGKGIGESMHEAWFRGVDNAQEITRAIRERVRRHRDAGLGDPDEPHDEVAPTDLDPVLAAARHLRDETHALRAAVEPHPLLPLPAASQPDAGNKVTNQA